jgi:hypothetical protein
MMKFLGRLAWLMTWGVVVLPLLMAIWRIL